MSQNRNTIAIFTSAARTATVTSNTFLNKFNKGAHVIIDVTAASATPSVTFALQAKDGLSGQWYSLITSAAITGVGTTRLTVAPGTTAAANVTVADQVPRVLRVVATHADADSITYSVGLTLLI